MPEPGRRPLPRRFFQAPTPSVARDMVGCTLWVEQGPHLAAGRIVETEAYLGQGEDPASHAHGGPTPRSQVMFGPAGLVYVYFIYGMHHCFNVVTGGAGVGGAVLVRALEPLVGAERMAELAADGASVRRLCSGPGRLCRALGLDLTWNAMPLGVSRKRDPNISLARRVWLAAGQSPRSVVATKRVGIRQAKGRPLRFCDPCSAALSRPLATEG